MDKSKLKIGKSKKVKKESINLSETYEVYSGGFGIKGHDDYIPTFICSRDVNSLKLDLITFEKLLKTKNWPISKILQREVNQERVKEIAKKYIEGNAPIKYFPPIVVALIPRNGDLLAEKFNEKKIGSDYEKSALTKIFDKSNLDKESRDDFIKEAESVTESDGLFIKRVYEDLNYNILSWDKSKFYAIIIDGQHRFEALKLASNDPSSDYNMYEQDVIFIDASNKGLSKTQKNKLTPTEIFRRIFIDINRNPEQVSKSRQILMDDADVASIFVQAILDDDQDDQENYLMPELVDWHSNASKFELPYITSVLNLHSIFFSVLLSKNSINEISDLTSSKKVKSWNDRLNNYFLIDEYIDDNNEEIEKLSETYNRYKVIWDHSDELYEYDRRILKVVRKQFELIYRKSIVNYFNTLRPYSETITLLKKNKVFDRSSTINDSVLKSQKNLTTREHTVFSKLKGDLLLSLKSDYYLLLNVVGQKAMFQLYYQELCLGRGVSLTEEKHLEITKGFITKINAVFDLLVSQKIFLFGPKEKEKKYCSFRNKNATYKALKKYRAVDTCFWDNFLYYGESIKYNSIGQRAIYKVLDLCYKCVGLDNDSIDKIPVLIADEYTVRVKRILIDNLNVKEHIAEKDSKDLLNARSEYIKSIFKK